VLSGSSIVVHLASAVVLSPRNSTLCGRLSGVVFNCFASAIIAV